MWDKRGKWQEMTKPAAGRDFRRPYCFSFAADNNLKFLCIVLGLDWITTSKEEEEEEVGSNYHHESTTFCVEHRTLFCQIFPLSNNLEYPVFHGVMGDGIFNPLVLKQL